MRITLWGFYVYSDKTLFNNVQLPEQFNKADLIELILYRAGDLYTYYQQPKYLQLNIINCFKKACNRFGYPLFNFQSKPSIPFNKTTM